MLNYKKGISFLEIIIVVAIVGLLAVVVLPMLSTIRNNQVLKTATTDIVSALDKAKSQSTSSIDSSEYGIHFEADQIVIFKGMSYSAVDPDNEYIAVYSPATISSISLTGGAVDVYFDRLSALPNKTGSITVSLGASSKIITISSTGAISMN